MFSFMFHSECRGCIQKFEPETIDTILRMDVEPTDKQAEDYDDLIKAIKLSQGLCLQTYSLHQRFISIYVRASHDKQAALLDWTKNKYDGTEIGTIRFTQFLGVGGSTTGGNSYINNNYSQQQDIFSPNSKFGGYITADYNNRIMGYITTAGGGGAAEADLAVGLANRIYDSWGANPAQFFNTLNQRGMREIVRGGTYDNNGTITNRTLLFQAEIDQTGGNPLTVRRNFDLNFYSLARNSSTLGNPNGSPQQINTEGFAMFQFHGKFDINSKKLLVAVENYLSKVGAI